MMTTKRFNALDADLISSSRAQQVAVTEFPWVILVLVISVSSFLHRILRPVVVSGRPRENCCPSCSSRQSAAAWLPLVQWEHATNRICAQKVGACAHTDRGLWRIREMLSNFPFYLFRRNICFNLFHAKP